MKNNFVYDIQTKKKQFTLLSIGILLICCNSHLILSDIPYFYTNLWTNGVYFIGIALIGIFFFALQYVTQAGWSVSILRIPETFGHWLWIGSIILILTFTWGYHDIFHWTHTYLYDIQDTRYDAIIAGKKSYLNIPFFSLRSIIYFIIWIGLFHKMRSISLQSDFTINSTKAYQKQKKYSTIFIIFFAITSSTAAWDWILAIDTHWFSTLFGWYVFSSWFVAGLSMITFLVVMLKEAGYMPIVNANHLHDLGKYLFAFSIFWAYLWLAQFLLIYYANIPEETIYYVERIQHMPYRPLFYLNLLINFFFPFLFLMKKNAKRYTIFLKIISLVLLVGHWLDFYLMISPGILKENGQINLFAIGMALVFFATFLHIFFSQFTKKPIIPQKHPLLHESKHYHS